MRQSRASPASKARRARFCVKPFRPRHHRLPRGPSREAVVSVCLMHPTKGFCLMTGSTVRMPSNLSLTDCKARVTSRAQGAIGVCSSHPQASRHYHQRQRRPYGPHQQWRRGPKPNRRPRPQPLCHTGSRCGGSRRGVGWVSLCVFDCASLCLVDSATARLSATAQQAPLRLAHAGRSLLATSHLLLGFVLGPIQPRARRHGIGLTINREARGYAL